MKNIVNQNTCSNCKHVYVKAEQDENTCFYCNITNDRPRSGGRTVRYCEVVGYEECFNRDENGKRLPDKEIIKRQNKWFLWIKNKEVYPYQICDYWKIRL